MVCRVWLLSHDNMSRMRTDLRPAGGPHRTSPGGKLPPVRNPKSYAPGSAKSNEWQSDMVKGLQMQMHNTPSPSSSVRTSSDSPKEEEKKACSLDQPQQRSRQSDNKELEKLKQIICSLQKMIEKLRAEIETKTSRILEFEEHLSIQETHFKEQLAKLNSSLDEKQKKIEELKKKLVTKDMDIKQMKEEFKKEKEETESEHVKKVEEMNANYQKECATRDEKLRNLKMHMASALGDNSRERQQQLDELTRELTNVSEEAAHLKSKLQNLKPSLQGNCQNCHVVETQLQSKIIDVRDKELVIIELQQVCDKMEKQLIEQDALLRKWTKTQGKGIR